MGGAPWKSPGRARTRTCDGECGGPRGWCGAGLAHAPPSRGRASVRRLVGRASADLVASLYAGASLCLFESAYAAELGLDLTAGLLTRLQTANSTFDAYGHEVEIDVLGIVTHSLVYFFAEPSIRKNVLGRGGWLDRVRVGLVDHDDEIYLAAHD